MTPDAAAALITELESPSKFAPTETPTYSGKPIVGSTVSGSPTNPLTFPIKGRAGSGRSYWTGMTLFVGRAVCTLAGKCQTTDRYTSTVTINPGPTATRVNTSNRYFPSTGYFGNKHLQMWALTNSQIKGSANTGQLPAKGVDYVRYPSRKGLGLQQGITLWVYLIRQGRYSGDSGKTTQGKCAAAANNNICRY